jgi:predicted DNA-binding transcriptional regulator AlpA
MTRADNDNEPRLLTKKAAAAYVGVSAPTFAKWVLAGIMPASVSITKMWDRKAIDSQLDKISGLEVSNADDGYELRKRERDAKKVARTR